MSESLLIEIKWVLEKIKDDLEEIKEIKDDIQKNKRYLR